MSANPLLGVMNGAAQTEYYVAPPMGVPGQQTFIANPVAINSYPVGDDFIACGRAVIAGDPIAVAADTYGNQNSPYPVLNVAADTTADKIIGVTVWDGGARSGPDRTPGKYQFDMFGVMSQGHMCQQIYENTTADAPAYCVVNAANSVNAPVGAFVATDLGGAAVAMTNVFWHASYTAGATAVGVVRIAIR